MNPMTFIAEQRIREAMEQGCFDNVPGAGKPLQLEDQSHIPPELRMAYTVLRNAGYVPQEVEDRKEAYSLAELLSQGAYNHDEKEKLRQMQKLDVLLARMGRERNCALVLKDNTEYYSKVVNKVH